MLTTVLYHWCPARIRARDEGGDTSIPEDFSCPLPIEPTIGSHIAIQILGINKTGTTVRFDETGGNVESSVQEWSDDEEIK